MHSDKNSPSSPYYKPVEQIILRFPLLPADAYHNLAAGGPVNYQELDERIKYAVMVASQTLAESLERKHATEKDRQKARSRLLRYLIRMSTRCTPFGVFAGVAMASMGDKTDVSLADAAPRTYTRPDMDWLLRFIRKLETRAEIRRQTHIIANPTIFTRGDRVYLQERLSAGDPEVEPRVSIRATRVVKTVLELASSPIVYEDVVKGLLAGDPRANREKVERLLDGLLEQTILTTELRPALTVADPVEHLLGVLSKLPAASPDEERLRSFLAAVQECDDGSFAERLSKFTGLRDIAREIAEPSSNPVAQVDSSRALRTSSIARKVAEEVARAAETMLSITSYPKGFDVLRTYRNAFTNKYGQDREVPVLELLDPNFGLGVPTEYTDGDAFGNGRVNSAARDQLLLKLASEAIRDKNAVVELDADIVKKLTTWSPREKNAPLSLDICAFVAARSAAEIDAGNFRIVIGPNIGADSAGKMLGRFAHMGGESARNTLRAIAAVEKKHSAGKLWAELVYLPRKYRAGNVAIRPATQEYEITLGVAPSVAPEKVIPISELLAGVKDGRFYLRWSRRDEEVYISSGHMLHAYGAPPICRFFSDIGQPPRAGITSFDWGPAADFPFLPRVQVGKAVLAPARWRVDAMTFEKTAMDTPERFREAFEKWRTAWSVPRYVYLANVDNRLLLDTRLPEHIEELREEFSRSSVSTLQEAYPSLEHAWVPGPDGNYLTEMVVSLVPAAPSEPAASQRAPRPPSKSESPHAQVPLKKEAAAPARFCAPGGEWLFFKLYCGRELEEDLLMECKRLAEGVLANGYAEDFFFIRYADPEAHIRIRFQGDPRRLTEKAYPHICSWARGLQEKDLCLKFALDTYVRETERYGGPRAIGLAEKLFAADSEAVLGILAAERASRGGPRRMTTAVASLNHLLGDMGLAMPARIEWCKKYVDSRDAVSKAYRDGQNQLREALANPGITLGVELGRILLKRRERLGAIALEYRSLEETGELRPPYWDILRSVVHMHCNRLLGIDRVDEQKALGLLYRTLQSLSAIKAVQK